MATTTRFVRHVLNGGWASDFGPNADVGLSENDKVLVPYLINAENILYTLNGGARKSEGSVKLNSTALESGADVTGVFDAWLMGATGAPAQHRIVHVGTKIKKDDADGTFTDLFTGLDPDKTPSYLMFEDLVIMSSDSTVDVPKSWNGTVAQNLAGSPPNFAFATEHKNRVWAAGDAALPSRLYYSTYLNGADWTGSGSGHIDISPNDGDRITGLVSHKNDLWVFKGPYTGSITRITGSAPTGPDGFSRILFINGVGAVAHNSIFSFPGAGAGDIGFLWSDGSIRSLNATASFGDYASASLSRPIQGWIREHVNFTVLDKATAVNYDAGGYVLFSIAKDSSSTNNTILALDYRFTPPRWAEWTAYNSVSLMTGIDPDVNSRPIIFAGGNDGFVRRLNQQDRSLDGSTSINYKITYPFLNYGSGILMKTLSIASLSLAPKNDGEIILGWTRDNSAQQTINIAQGGSDVLAPSDASQFTLGTSALGGASLSDRFVDLEEGGEFRNIQYELKNSVNFEDVEVHALSTAILGGGWSTEND